MKLLCLPVTLALLVAPVAAMAQVIEIDSSGAVQTYDRLTLFDADGAVGVDHQRKASTTADTTTLLIEASRLQGLDPSLLEAVAWQESRGRQSAVSPKGARGIMQLMPGTAIALGVRSDDPAENIRGGALYLRQQIDRFGSVPLALAAYNAGPGAVLRYGDVPPYRETIGYVARIMGRWQQQLSLRLAASAAPSRTNLIQPREGPSE
ncbi:MAG: lytic transglycosylase domain-containing protein [Sphingomicrobium sp.]